MASKKNSSTLLKSTYLLFGISLLTLGITLFKLNITQRPHTLSLSLSEIDSSNQSMQEVSYHHTFVLSKNGTLLDLKHRPLGHQQVELLLAKSNHQQEVLLYIDRACPFEFVLQTLSLCSNYGNRVSVAYKSGLMQEERL